jgi:nucleoside-diphosphate-sugar epimerase
MTGGAATLSVVVTGASGFIGRALVRALARRGAAVVAVTRGDATVPGAVWTRVTDYRETPSPAGATLVHLAEQANISAANQRGPAHVADVCALTAALVAKGFRRIVYASSGQVYRSGSDPYLAGKREAEKLVLAAGGAVVRLANVYGPGMPVRTLIGDIMRQIPGSGPLRLHNDAPRRDFLWIDDAAEGLMAIALGEKTGIFDLGTGISISAGDLARLALAAAGERERQVVSDVSVGGDDDVISLDMTPVRTQFGWTPTVDAGEGLARLVKANA